MKSNTIQMLTNAVMTGTSTVNSDPIELDQIYGFAIQVTWTGAAVGSFKLQASCDAPGRTTQTSNGGPDSVTNWSDITGTSQAVSGTPGNFMWNINGCFYRYVRLVYTNSSAAGTFSAKAVVKG